MLNQAVARLRIFVKPNDYEAFIGVLEETRQIVPPLMFAIVSGPNHWPFVIRPEVFVQVNQFLSLAYRDGHTLQRSRQSPRHRAFLSETEVEPCGRSGT